MYTLHVYDQNVFRKSYNVHCIVQCTLYTFAGIDIDAADNTGVTPLISTSQFGQPLTTAWLLHRGASAHVRYHFPITSHKAWLYNVYKCTLYIAIYMQ